MRVDHLILLLLRLEHELGLLLLEGTMVWHSVACIERLGLLGGSRRILEQSIHVLVEILTG